MRPAISAGGVQAMKNRAATVPGRTFLPYSSRPSGHGERQEVPQRGSRAGAACARRAAVHRVPGIQAAVKGGRDRG